MKLIRYAGGSDADEDTTVLADETPSLHWNYDRVYPEHAGDLQVGLHGPSTKGSPADSFELIVDPDELGAMLAVVRAQDVGAVMSGFLNAAPAEVVGAVVGAVVAHLARKPTGRGKSR